MNGVKTMSGALGVLMTLLGAIWILQGFDVSFAPRSFMTADINWTYRGVAFGLAGLALLIWGLRGAGGWRNVLGALGMLCAAIGFLWLLQTVSLREGGGIDFQMEWAPRAAVALAVAAVLIFIAAAGKSAR